MTDRYSTFSSEGEEEGVKFVYGLVHEEINYSGEITVHEVQPGETLDTISYAYYNNPEYWWVIAWYNNIIDPFCEISPGKTIDIPYNLAEVLENIG